MTLSHLLAAPALWLLAVIEYLIFSHSITLRGTIRAATVFAVTSVAALLPMAMADAVPPDHSLVLAATAAFLYQPVYPLMRNVDKRTRKLRATYAADPAAGLCIFGLLCSMLLLGGVFEWIVGPIELALTGVVITQVVYYLLYGSSMDAYGFRLMTQTNTNEVIEFVRYYPLWLSAALVCVFSCVIAAAVWANLPAAPFPPVMTMLKLLACMALCTALLLVGRRRSVLARSGFASFYMAKLDNTRRLQAYPTARARRRKGIDAVAQGSPYPGPSTIVLVIGESANRDYMSSFAPHLKRDTTPWLRACHEDDPKHWMLFPNAYSCGMHTFMALEQGLTEANQTAPDGFVNAASIVDMARAAGRRVPWYSNQGHLGASLSQVSVVADEADETLWTQQKPGLPPYDTELLPFLDRVDPTKDNLVVLHLKGNHFSFENRGRAAAASVGARIAAAEHEGHGVLLGPCHNSRLPPCAHLHGLRRRAHSAGGVDVGGFHHRPPRPACRAAGQHGPLLDQRFPVRPRVRTDGPALATLQHGQLPCPPRIRPYARVADNPRRHHRHRRRQIKARIFAILKLYFQMSKIQSEAQYRWALQRVEELLPLVKDDTPLTDPNSIELELLSGLVADYSDVHYAIGEPTLVDVIKLRMYEMGLTQVALSKLLGINPSRISEYLSGKKHPTLQQARTISQKLNIDPAIVLGV